SRADCDFLTEATPGETKDGNTGKGLKYAVEREDSEACGVRVNTPDFEGRHDEIGVKRRRPGGRSGMAPKRIAVAVPGSHRAGDAAHFPTEGKVVFTGTEPVAVGNHHHSHAHQESRGNHPCWRCARVPPPLVPSSGKCRLFTYRDF